MDVEKVYALCGAANNIVKSALCICRWSDSSRDVLFS